MTLKELNNIRHLKCAVANMEERITRLNAKIRPGGGGFEAIPHGSGEVHSAVEENALKRIVLLSRFENLQARYLAELERAENFIETIDDVLTAEIFRLRFIDGSSWAAVARKMNVSEDCVKSICYRYLEKSEK